MKRADGSLSHTCHSQSLSPQPGEMQSWNNKPFSNSSLLGYRLPLSLVMLLITLSSEASSVGEQKVCMVAS